MDEIRLERDRDDPVSMWVRKNCSRTYPVGNAEAETSVSSIMGPQTVAKEDPRFLPAASPSWRFQQTVASLQFPNRS